MPPRPRPHPAPSTCLGVAGTQVRIYQVKKEDPLGRDLRSANAFAQGKKKKKTKPLVRRKAIV